MTQDQPPAYAPQPPAPKRSNPLGLTALIVGIVAIVGCAIPIVNFVSIFLGAVALILGIIGLVQKNRPRGLAIAGSILGVIALLVGILTASFYAAAADGISKALESSAPAPAESSAAAEETVPSTEAAAGSRTVHYEVTSDGKTLSSVSYLTVNDGKSSTQQDTSATAPWSKDVPIVDEGLFTSSVFSLVAQAGADATTISCKITADGKTIQESTSTGPYAVASCSGSAS
jgi:hypothetical protein